MRSPMENARVGSDPPFGNVGTVNVLGIIINKEPEKQSRFPGQCTKHALVDNPGFNFRMLDDASPLIQVHNAAVVFSGSGGLENPRLSGANKKPEGLGSPNSEQCANSNVFLFSRQQERIAIAIHPCFGP